MDGPENLLFEQGAQPGAHWGHMITELVVWWSLVFLICWLWKKTQEDDRQKKERELEEEEEYGPHRDTEPRDEQDWPLDWKKKNGEWPVRYYGAEMEEEPSGSEAEAQAQRQERPPVSSGRGCTLRICIEGKASKETIEELRIMINEHQDKERGRMEWQSKLKDHTVDIHFDPDLFKRD